MEDYLEIIKKYPPQREYLIQMLTDLQDQSPRNYLSEEALKSVVRYTNLTMSAVMGVVQYYSMFSTDPKGKYVVRVCKSPVCINKESDRIAQAVMQKYAIPEMGKSSDDGLISIEYCECLGRCSQGSAVSINNHFLERTKAINVISKIEQYIKNQSND